MAQSEDVIDKTFYSLGDRSLEKQSSRSTSDALRRQARKEAEKNSSTEPQPSSARPVKFATKSGRVISQQKHNVAASRSQPKVVQKPLVEAPNPYLATAQSQRLQRMVAERARQLK